MSFEHSVSDNRGRHRYEAQADGGVVAGFVEYQDAGEPVVLTTPRSTPGSQGRGWASALARAALDDIRARGLKALVICPFILEWIRRHPEYVDLLFNAPASHDRRRAPTEADGDDLAPAAGRGLDRHPRHAAHGDADRRQDPALETRRSSTTGGRSPST